MVLPPPKQEGDSQMGTPFNMAVATLKRIDDLLVKMSAITTHPSLPLEEKQSLRLATLKELLLQSSVLIKGSFVEDNKKEMLDLREETVKVFVNGDMGAQKQFILRKIFSQELSNKIDGHLLNILTKLQENNVFMPSRADPKYGWGMQ